MLLRAFGGWSLVVGERIATTRETIYDLASLTKVVATVTLSLALAERGLWTLDDPVVRWLPGYPRDDTTLRQLLTHTSGLIPHREFYRHARGVAEIRRAVFAEAAADGVAPGPVELQRPQLHAARLGARAVLRRPARAPLPRDRGGAARDAAHAVSPAPSAIAG